MADAALPPRAEDDFTSLFEFLPIGAYRSSVAGRQLRANAALVRLNGYDSEGQMIAAVRDIGSEWYVDPDRRARFRDLLARDGQVTRFVSEVRRHRTRERIWIVEHAHVVRDAAGAPRYYEGTVEEITEQLATREALLKGELQYRQIATQLPGVVYRMLLKPDGRREYSFVSEGMRALFGVTPEQVLADGGLLQRMRHADDRERVEAAGRLSLACGEPLACEFRIVLADGSQKWVQMHANTLSLGPEGNVRSGMMLDITARKHAEAMRLERDRAELAQRTMSEMLSRISHELRTPLNAVLGLAQLLTLDASLAPRQAAWVRQIHASGEHLLALVEDVLDLSSARSGELRLHPSAVGLRELVDQTWAMAAAAAQAEGLPATAWANRVAPEITLEVDRRRLTQVLANLLSNAIRYNRPGGSVEAKARAALGGLAIAVQDSGQGLSAHQLERLFQPFDRLGAEHGRIVGRGIGLALTRQLVLAMGGRIEVASAPGAGSTFTLWLPLAPMRPDSAPSPG